MEEQIKAQEELSLSEIFKVLLRKLKILLITLLCGVIVGVGFAVLTTHNVKYYGTTVSFYINPRLDSDSSTHTESQYGVYGAYGKHVMNNMVILLASDLFAEQLILDDQGLPNNKRLEAIASEELNQKVAAAREAQNTADEKIALAATYLSDLNEKNSEYAEWNSKANTLWAAYRNANPDLTLNSTPTKINGETELNEAIEERDKLEAEVVLAKDALKNANKDANNHILAAETATNEALELWRDSYEGYQSELEFIKESVSFSYIEKTDTTENLDDLARSFIYVDISVLNSESFANGLLDSINKKVPEFVEENMAVPSGYDGTNCQRITRLDDIEHINEGYTFTSAVKYGLLLGVAALIVACITVIVIDRSNKRLRDFETTMDRFNVPVLGVIPSISYKEQTAEKPVAAQATATVTVAPVEDAAPVEPAAPVTSESETEKTTEVEA